MSAEQRNRKIPKPATARVFFALWPSAEVAGHLGDVAERAVLTFGGRATRRDTIHLTLAFLGNVPETRLPELVRAAGAVHASSFSLSIDQLGTWQHNHLLWAGSLVRPAELDGLHAQLGVALAQAGFRVGGAGRAYFPHVTLVRHLPESQTFLDTATLPPVEAIAWLAERFVLVRSTLSADGPTYRIIEEFKLAATKQTGCEYK